MERDANVSMIVMCDDIFIVEHDEIRPGLPNAPIVMEYNSNGTEP